MIILTQITKRNIQIKWLMLIRFFHFLIYFIITMWEKLRLLTDTLRLISHSQRDALIRLRFAHNGSLAIGTLHSFTKRKNMSSFRQLEQQNSSSYLIISLTTSLVRDVWLYPCNVLIKLHLIKEMFAKVFLDIVCLRIVFPFYFLNCEITSFSSIFTDVRIFKVGTCGY